MVHFINIMSINIHLYHGAMVQFSLAYVAPGLRERHLTSSDPTHVNAKYDNVCAQSWKTCTPVPVRLINNVPHIEASLVSV